MRAAPPQRVSVPGERHARREAAARLTSAQAPRRSRLHRALRPASAVSIVAGVLLLADATLTLVWEEPVTHLLAQRQQAELGDELDGLRAARLDRLDQRALAELRGPRERVAFLARSLGRTARPGSAIGELRLPRVKERFVLVKGSDPTSLRKGPGSYDGVGLPGVPGTAAVAGHRTTYGAPFRHIDRLRTGDAVVVEMPYATFTYRVERTRIVVPSDLSVLVRRRYDRLVLSACHPLYSAKQRIVVLARLERTVATQVAARPA